MFSLKGIVKRENNVTMVKNMSILKAALNIKFYSLIGTLERFSIVFTANGKRQPKIFSLIKNNEAFLV